VQRSSHRFGSQQPTELVEAFTTLVVVRQTHTFHRIVWQSVPITWTVEWPLVQWSILVTTTQHTIEVALTCAYC
jgi:hypothetical protein